MKFKSELRAKIDKQGRLVLPPELIQQYGLQPGDTLPVTESVHGIRLRPPVTLLRKTLYRANQSVQSHLPHLHS